MTTTTSTITRPATDSWTLRIMAEAAAYRAANPATTPTEAASDAHLDAYFALCQDLATEIGTTHDEDPTTPEAPRPRTASTGASNYANDRNAATPAQLAYLGKLAAQLGTELQTPRDKAHASLIIDGAKKTLAARGPAATAPARTATEGQRTYLADLLATRAHDLGEVDVEALTFDQASAAITTLRTAPRVSATAAHGIAAGRYAFQPTDGAAQFYRVGRTGRITVQAGPAEHPYRGQLNEALRWIADNQRDAAVLYGHLLGVCGRCGRELTDEASRAAGIGPVCASKF